MTTGLVLGKFAPLHRGHQSLIEAARRENDHVIVIVYGATDVTSIPLLKRELWIKTLYPDVRVIQAWDGPMEVGDTPEIREMHEAYLLRVLKDVEITAFYSSEFYGAHVSQALNAVDRRIDTDRVRVPVSGTAIRNDPYTNREFLAPLVYNDLITKVVFLGAPSTGKTTLAEKLADLLDTVWMPEYGREYWEQNQVERKLTLEQLVEIAETHRDREAALIAEANRYLFVDTDATTTSMFSKYYHGDVHPRLEEFAAATRQRYDLFFLCGAEISYDDTWDRSGDANRHVLQQQTREDLFERRIPFITLVGSVAERVDQVKRILSGFDKFASIGDNLLTSIKAC